MCDGQIEQGVGCTKYAGSDEHQEDTSQETFLRSGGLGFGVSLDSGDAMMSMHLQAVHGLSPDEAHDAITLRSP